MKILFVCFCVLNLALAETDIFLREPAREDCPVPLLKCPTTGRCVLFKAQCPRDEHLRVYLDLKDGQYVDSKTEEIAPSISVPWGTSVHIFWPAGHPVGVFHDSSIAVSDDFTAVTDTVNRKTTITLTPQISSDYQKYSYGCTSHNSMLKGTLIVKKTLDFLKEHKHVCASGERYCAREDRCIKITQMCVPIPSCQKGHYRCPDMTCALNKSLCSETAIECHEGLAPNSLDGSCTCSGHEIVQGEILPYFPCLDGGADQARCRHEYPAKHQPGFYHDNVCDTEFLGCPPGKVFCGKTGALKCASSLQECANNERCDNYEKICGWKRNKMSASLLRGNLSDGLVTVCGVQCNDRDDYKPKAQVVRAVSVTFPSEHVLKSSADDSRVAFKMVVGQNGFALANGAGNAVTDFDVSSPDTELVERGRYKLFKGNRTRVSSFVTISPSQVLARVQH